MAMLRTSFKAGLAAAGRNDIEKVHDVYYAVKRANIAEKQTVPYIHSGSHRNELETGWPYGWDEVCVAWGE